MLPRKNRNNVQLDINLQQSHLTLLAGNLNRNNWVMDIYHMIIVVMIMIMIMMMMMMMMMIMMMIVMIMIT